MSKQDQKGKIQTVLGLIDPQDLGLTMTHEHLLIDFSVMFNPTPDVTTQRMAHAPVSMENLGWIRQFVDETTPFCLAEIVFDNPIQGAMRD